MGTQQRKVILIQLSIGLFLISFMFVIIDVSMSIALADIVKNLVGDSGFLFSLVASIVFLGNIIMIFPLAKLSDRIGRKNTLIISISISMMGILLLYFATQFWMILVLRFVIGLNSIMGVISALVIDHFPEEERGKPLSMYSIGLVAGYLVGSIFGGPIYSWLGEKNTFLFLGGVAFIGILNVLVNIKDATKTETSLAQEEGDKPKPKTWFYIRQNRSIIALLGLNFFNMLAISGSGSYAVYVIFTHFNLSDLTGGLYLIPVQIVEVVMFAVLGARVKNFDKVYKLMFGVIVILIGFTISFIFLEHPIQFSMVAAFFGMGIAIIMQSSDAISHKLIPLEHKTNLVSIYRFVGLVGNILGPILFGLMVDYIWVYSPGIFFAIGLLFVELLYWKWINKGQTVKLEVLYKD